MLLFWGFNFKGVVIEVKGCCYILRAFEINMFLIYGIYTVLEYVGCVYSNINKDRMNLYPGVRAEFFGAYVWLELRCLSSDRALSPTVEIQYFRKNIIRGSLEFCFSEFCEVLVFQCVKLYAIAQKNCKIRGVTELELIPHKWEGEVSSF